MAITIPEDELIESFVRSSGPGGQNVNKVSSAVQLRFDVVASPSLPDEVKERLLKLAGRRATGDGVIVISANRFRDQVQNRSDARARLAELVAQACIRPIKRRATRPTLGSKQRRLDSKTTRAGVKAEPIAPERIALCLITTRPLKPCPPLPKPSKPRPARSRS
jgi:ribosome-associated protein